MSIKDRIEEAINETEARIEYLNEEIWLKEEALADLEDEDEIIAMEESIRDLKDEVEDLETELREIPVSVTEYAEYQHMVAVESRYW